MRPIAAVALLPLLLGAAPAKAQGLLYGFGDSQLDTRNTCALGAALGVYPGGSGACSNGPGFLQRLSPRTGFAFNKANDYAVGGAGTGDGSLIVPLPTGQVLSYPQTNSQVTQFLAAGGRFTPSDLVVFSALTNNYTRLISNPALTGEALAQQSLADNTNSISRLVAAGARNLLVYGGGDVSLIYGNVSTPEQAARERAFGLTYAAQLPTALAPLAGPGVQIRVFDRLSLYPRIAANPGLFGFTDGANQCSTDPACRNAPLAVQNQHFLWDIHPTTAGFDLVSRYAANLLGAQDEIPLQATLLRGGTDGFSNSILNRLEAVRMQAGLGAAAEPGRRWSVYAYGLYAGAGDAGLGTSGTGLAGRDPEANGGGGVIGAEYSVRPGLTVGGSFSYSSLSARGQYGGKTSADLPQFAAYASNTATNWFLDGVITGGPASLDVNRPGVIDTLRASLGGSTLSVSVRSAYLFDVGPVRLGPLGQLSYGRAAIDRYTETGDPVLTQTVHAQTADTFVASVGAQARFPFAIGSTQISPFLNLTAEHDFLGTRRWIVAEETAAAGLPIWTRAGAGNSGVYGRFAGGAAAKVGPGVSLFLTGGSTFARGGGDLRNATAGVQFSF